MPLITLPDGSHRNVPGGAQIPMDVEQLVNPTTNLPVGQQLGTNYWQEVDLGGGLYFFRFNFMSEGRGRYKQQGYFETDLANFSENNYANDDYEINRHFFRPGIDESPRPTASLGRLMGAEAFNRYFMALPDISLGAQELFEDQGSPSPSIASVPTFSMPASATAIYCMLPGMVNDDACLFIGYDASSGAAGNFSLQVVTGIDPWVASCIPVTSGPVWGVVQLPIDGNMLQIYASDTTGTNIFAVSTDVGVGSVVVHRRAALRAGGYTVGVVNLDGNPEVFYAVPVQASAAMDVQLLNADFILSSYRVQLYRSDLRGFEVRPVDLALPTVKWITPGLGCLFYCDGLVSHRFRSRGRDIPVDPATDRPYNISGLELGTRFVRYCRGHWRWGHKFFWEENIVDSTNASQTVARRFEYDPYLNRVSPVSQDIPLGGTGIRSAGGFDMPITRSTGNLISFTTPGWRYQYQNLGGELGFGKRLVGNTGSAQAFETTGVRWSTRLRSLKHPGALMFPSRAFGPTMEDLRAAVGSGDGSVAANVQLALAITGAEPAYFNIENGNHRPVWHYDQDQCNWAPEWQLIASSTRDTVGGLSHLRTPNVFYTVEGYMWVPPGPPPPQNYADAGADLAPPSNPEVALF